MLCTLTIFSVIHGYSLSSFYKNIMLWLWVWGGEDAELCPKNLETRENKISFQEFNC